MNRKLKIVIGLVIIGVVIAGLYLSTPASTKWFEGANRYIFSNEYGETLVIDVGVKSGGRLSGKAQISNSLYEVSGSYISGGTNNSFSGVADQEVISISFTVTITGTNIENPQIVDAKLKAVDSADSSYKLYSPSQALPISTSLGTPNTLTFLNNYAISTHLTDCSASTTSAKIKYYFYLEVQAVGSKSGQTLTGTINYDLYIVLQFTKNAEEGTTGVETSIGVASWINSPTVRISIAIIIGIAIVSVAHYIKKKEVKRN